MHAFDRQTDRQTDGQTDGQKSHRKTALHCMQRGKNKKVDVFWDTVYNHLLCIYEHKMPVDIVEANTEPTFSNFGIL